MLPEASCKTSFPASPEPKASDLPLECCKQPEPSKTLAYIEVII